MAFRRVGGVDRRAKHNYVIVNEESLVDTEFVRPVSVPALLTPTVTTSPPSDAISIKAPTVFEQQVIARESWTVEGTVDAQGLVSCEELSVRGVSELGRLVSCEELSVRGVSELGRLVSCEELSVRGVSELGGLVRARGPVHVDGPLRIRDTCVAAYGDQLPAFFAPTQLGFTGTFAYTSTTADLEVPPNSAVVVAAATLPTGVWLVHWTVKLYALAATTVARLTAGVSEGYGGSFVNSGICSMVNVSLGAGASQECIWGGATVWRQTTTVHETTLSVSVFNQATNGASVYADVTQNPVAITFTRLA